MGYLLFSPGLSLPNVGHAVPQAGVFLGCII